MFLLTAGSGQNMAFPDVCKTPTPVGPIPLPYPNIAMTSTTNPVVPNITVDAMPVINQASFGMVSQGDEAGAAGGVVDSMICGQTCYQVGCSTITMGGAPAQRLTSITGQNAAGATPNAVGACLAPSQTTVLTLG